MPCIMSIRLACLPHAFRRPVLSLSKVSRILPRSRCASDESLSCLVAMSAFSALSHVYVLPPASTYDLRDPLLGCNTENDAPQFASARAARHRQLTFVLLTILLLASVTANAALILSLFSFETEKTAAAMIACRRRIPCVPLSLSLRLTDQHRANVGQGRCRTPSRTWPSLLV